MLKRFISKNKTLIFKFNINESITLFTTRFQNFEYGVATPCVGDIQSIISFFKKLNRVEFNNFDSVKLEMQQGSSFHFLKDKEIIVAGMWVHTGCFIVNAPSFFAFQNKPNEKVCFNKDSAYSSHNAVAKDYLGKHLYIELLQNVFDYLLSNGIKEYVICTGFDNFRMIRSCQKYGGKLIGIIETIHFFFIKRKKTHFLDLYEKNWNCGEERRL